MTRNKLKENYIDSIVNEPFKLLEFMRESEKVRTDICPSIGKEIGEFLYFIAIFSKSRKILEVGTSIGYSTIWLALAAKGFDGKVDTIEVADRLISEAKTNFSLLGLNGLIECHQGLGENIIPELKGKYDMIFIDGATKSYEELYELSLKKLKKGGLLVFEDVLFAVTAKREIQRKNMDAFNKMIIKDERIEKTFLSIGDGLLLCLKK